MISCEDLNYSTSDFASSEEKMLKRLKKIDTIMGKKIILQRQRENLKTFEGIMLEVLSKFKDVT